LEWFESKAWYQKTLDLCISLADTSRQKLDSPELLQTIQHAPEEQDEAVVQLWLKGCAQMSQALHGKIHHNEEQSQKWLPKVRNMCAVVEITSPKQVLSLIRRQRHEAESANGQLIKQACHDLRYANRPADEWWHKLDSMCVKLDMYTVKKSDLATKCVAFEKLLKDGRVAKLFKAKPWYQRLASACRWMQTGGDASSNQPTVV
jgi:hypothetical protein